MRTSNYRAGSSGDGHMPGPGRYRRQTGASFGAGILRNHRSALVIPAKARHARLESAISVPTRWETAMKLSSVCSSVFSSRSAVLAAALLLASASVAAKDIKVTLTGAEETPPVTTSATGTGTIKVNEDKSVSGSIKTQGMKGMAAHIHTGAPGESGPPII